MGPRSGEKYGGASRAGAQEFRNPPSSKNADLFLSSFFLLVLEQWRSEDGQDRESSTDEESK